jgi:hypothetical protein
MVRLMTTGQGLVPVNADVPTFSLPEGCENS